MRILGALAACAAAVILAAPAAADTSCRGGQSFAGWLAEFRQEAAQAGISPAALKALDTTTFNRRIVARDRSQPTLSQSFLQYAGKAVSADRLKRGRAFLKKHSGTLAKVEQQFGVPAPVIVAFWGLETDYGGFTGNTPVLSAIATLAFDCRRSDEFRRELMAGLELIDARHLSADRMKGSWAGALGHVQFTPSTYLEHGVDFDRDGRIDLIGSIPDALASAGNYIRSLGWQRGAPWLEEVRVAATVPWQESARAIYQPRSFWSAVGVTRADGTALPADSVEAALILPMGRLGPAFLAYRNFGIYWEWNNSSNYSLVAAYFATRLAGAERLNHGNAPPILSMKDMREVQHRLNAIGYDAGPPDGRLGEKTRAGVKKAQLAFGMPADGYPTTELLKRLRQGR